MQLTYQKPLEKFGLSAKEAIVYETLLKLGTVPARVLTEETGLKRNLSQTKR